MLQHVSAVFRHPGVALLLAFNVLARIPSAGSSVLLVVHAHALTGSYAVAGIVAAANALALAVSAPLLGGLVDRRGQTPVLVVAGLVAGAVLLALAALPAGAPVALLVLLAAAAGMVQPPLGACLRTLWPDLLDHDPEAVRAAFSVEAAVLELTYIAGPLGLLTLAAATSSRVAVAALGIGLAVGTLAFAAQPASRAWRPHERADGEPAPPRSALSAPGVRTVVAIMLTVGVLVSGVEVAITAAMSEAGAPGATGPLLALWGVGSLAGGIVAARVGGARHARELALLLLAIALTHAVLAAGGGSPFLLGALLLVAGAGIAPVFGATSALTGELALPGTATEAFAWTSTALAAGVAVGAAAAGAIVDAAGGAGPAFVAAGAAGVVAAGVAMARGRSLESGATELAVGRGA
jgi:predicted MFS family arabinose efflux permease